MAALIDSISAGVLKALAEISTRGRALKGRSADVQAELRPPHQQLGPPHGGGPAEAMHGRPAHLRGSALGSPNLANDTARACSRPAASDPTSPGLR
jgi:hypothetical protein